MSYHLEEEKALWSLEDCTEQTTTVSNQAFQHQQELSLHYAELSLC